MLLPVTETWQLLHTFCTGKPAPLNCDEFQELQDALQDQCPSLCVLLTELHDAEKVATDPLPIYNYSFSGNWHQFLLVLSSTSSVALILQPKVVPPLLHMLEHKIS